MQGMSIELFAKELQRREEAKRDFKIPSEMLTLEIEQGGTTGTPIMNWKTEDEEFSSILTRHARGQLAARTGIPKRLMDRLLATPEYHGNLADLVNNIHRTEPKNTLVRTLDGDVRALLSDRYRRIDNLDIMGAVMPVLQERPDMQVRAHNLSENHMHFQVFFPTLKAEIGLGDVVTAGLTITNSETGTSSFKSELGLFRLVCLNGLIVNTSLKRYHVGRKMGGDEATELFSDETLAADDHALMLKVRDIVRGSLDEVAFMRHVEEARTAFGIELVRPVAAVEEITKRTGIGEGARDRVLELLLDSSTPGVQEAGKTMWGMINALTAYAKEQEFSKAIDIEREAGKLMALPGKQLLEIAEAA